MSSTPATDKKESSQITHVLNKDKKYLSEHGQKLFNAINCLLDEGEQLELTQALFKYQKDHNVFTLVRSCRELFDTSRKKSLMLFMRPVIPVKDRFHYDEYYKLFFPEEFSTGASSIFADLIPKDLLEKTVKKAEDKKKINMEKDKLKENEERMATIKMLEKVNFDLNVDIQKLMTKSELNDETAPNTKEEVKQQIEPEQKAIKIAGFRIIDLEPNEDESLGFDVCMGPTRTFIMISYVEPNSLVEKLGMKIGDELVSVNDTSFKMFDLDQAIEILSTAATLRIVLQTSGFLPDAEQNAKLQSYSEVSQLSEPLLNFDFTNEWNNPFGLKTNPPSESKTSLKRHIRRIVLRPQENENCLGFKIRGGIENSLGIFVSYIEPRSTADLIGLRICDQIIEVNGQTFSRVTHEDALLILKASLMSYKSNKLPIKIVVRYLGKLPLLKVIKSNKDSVTSIDKAFDYDTSVVLDENYQKENLERLGNFKNENSMFSNSKDFLLFKYYTGEYLKKNISIQYFIYLVLNHIQIDKKILLDNEEISRLIYNEDFSFYRRLLEFKLNAKINKIDLNNENVRFLKDDFKNSLIVRSTEVLNDLNINPVKKFNKFDNFDNEKLSLSKSISKSMDCLNQLFI